MSFTATHDGLSFEVATSFKVAPVDLRFVSQQKLITMGTHAALIEIENRINYINSPAFAAGILESNKTRPRAKRLTVEGARAAALANC